MALSDVLARLFGRRRAISYSLHDARATVLGMGPTELYRKQPALRAVVSFLADNVAGVPLKCYVRAADDDRPRDTTSVLALLLQRPSAGMTEHELVRALVSDYLIYGTALCVVLPDRSAACGWSVRHIPWSWVQSRETENGFDPSSYVVTNPYTGGRVTLDASDCIRFAQYDPAGTLDSSSPIEALREVLSEQVSAWNFRNSVWRNGGRVSAYLYRPRDTPWGDGARDRFSKSWKAKFSGEEGTDTGGTPLLEDGMELRTVQFNAREAEWAEATRLTREDVAAVYHVNPSQIWHTESQTYASAKDNARALYADTLSPIMDMIEERLNGFLVPMLGLDPSTHYVEFDLSAKLAASFEEQAGVLQSSAGGPWMTRNEVRARMNLPALEGGDELIVPLNVSEGGLAAPNDTAPTVERYGNAAPLPRAKGEGDAAPFDKALPDVRIHAKASPKVERDLERALRKFYERQRNVYMGELSKLDITDETLSDAIDAVFDAKREEWYETFVAELEACIGSPMSASAERALELLGLDPSSLDYDRVDEQAHSMCAKRAASIMENVRSKLKQDMDTCEQWTSREVRARVYDSFRDRMDGRISKHSTSMATAAANAGTCEGARQSGITCEKEWVATGHNTRNSHAAMSGVRVPIDGTFSVAGIPAKWPGDATLPPEETCNCCCRIDIVAGGSALRRNRNTREVAGELGLDEYNPEMLDAAIQRCQETVDCGGRLWDELTPGEKSKVLDELRTRDRKWVAIGEPCFRYKERGARPLDKERDVGTCLLLHGFNVKFAKETPPKKRFDAWLNDDAWEFKIPESYNDKTVKNQFKKALGKGTDRLLISATKNRASLDDLSRDVQSLFDSGDFKEIREVLLMSSDGENLVRMIRPLPES